MYIRSVRLADLARFGHLSQRVLRLAEPEVSVVGRTPFETSVRSWLPVRSGLRTFVLGDDRTRAFVQVAARDRGPIWDVVAIGSEADIADQVPLDDPAHPWVLLLTSAAVLATRRRVTRLLARVPEMTEEIACFRQAGWQPYGRETIFVREFAAGDRVADATHEPRTQRNGDAWAIHRLYFQTAPRQTQDAEAHTSNRWELRPRRPGGPREQGWLLEEGAEALAYTRALSWRKAHSVEWLFAPDHREVLPRLVRQTLARLPAAPRDRVYWRLPDYQQEAEPALREAGFSPIGSQALLVKYLAVKAAARERSFVPATRAKGRRVPSAQSYLRRAGER
ncbi:MAG: hypothetical protein IT340_00565 [Chloroflexi bacterium]|nr:hypothetical protein [Chloroflexota bacterium]